MSKDRGIFIAATGQNVGKTTVCLGLLSCLIKKMPDVGFIKPVGQRHVYVNSHLAVDKDVVLFKDTFQLQQAYETMSPIILPRGTTKKYLDQPTEEAFYTEKIQSAFNTIQSHASFTLVEGTGHVGVGSIVNLSNAKVAKILGLDIILIAQGGIGSTFDELALNKSLCDSYGVRIKGVILNKVLPDKAATITHYMQKALDRWNIPLLGVIPYDEYLLTPTYHDLSLLFKQPLISGKKHLYAHFAHTRVVATDSEYFSADNRKHQLIITPASREDIVEEFVKKTKSKDPETLAGEGFQAGIILTGTIPASSQSIKRLTQNHIPSLYVPLSLYETTQKIHNFVSKISSKDNHKIVKAINIMEQHLHFEKIFS